MGSGLDVRSATVWKEVFSVPKKPAPPLHSHDKEKGEKKTDKEKRGL